MCPQGHSELRRGWGPGARKAELSLQCELHPCPQDPLQQRTARAISQLATRRYQAGCRRARAEWPDSGSSCSSTPVCAICLEEFSEGQVKWARLEMGRVPGAGWRGLGMTTSQLHLGLCVLQGRDQSKIWPLCWASKNKLSYR